MNESTSIKLRPDFLTVLCILTFIGSGWGIFSSTKSYLYPDNQVNIVEIEDAFDDAMEDNNMNEEQRDLMENFLDSILASLTPDSVSKSSALNIISCLISLAGALLMWNLNKKGYFLYILSAAVLTIGSFVIYEGILGGIIAAATGFIGILFIILYGVNLMHMR